MEPDVSFQCLPSVADGHVCCEARWQPEALTAVSAAAARPNSTPAENSAWRGNRAQRCAIAYVASAYCSGYYNNSGLKQSAALSALSAQDPAITEVRLMPPLSGCLTMRSVVQQALV